MDKHKRNKRTGGGVEDRVYRHYKSIKRGGHDSLEWVETSQCGWLNNCKPGTQWVFFPHRHGYQKLTTPNSDWLLLARVHKMSVREVKDIVSKKRGWTPDVRKQVVLD